MKVSVIGAGNMGGAIVRGLSNVLAENNEMSLTVADPGHEKLDILKAQVSQLSITTCNAEAARDADVLFLVVKPWLVETVLKELASIIAERRPILVSVAATITPDMIYDILKSNGVLDIKNIFYAIPNTAIAYNQSMTFVNMYADASTESREKVKSILECLGDVAFVDLKKMDAGMAVSSCGMAYVMRFVRALMQGGVELGLTPAEARQAAIQTMEGAATLLKNNGTHPEEEIDRVTTPGGLTIKGLNALDEGGFTNAVVSALRKSVK